MTAITAFSLLIILSLRPIRITAYEFFFYAHIVLVLLVISIIVSGLFDAPIRILLSCAYVHTGQYA